VFRIHQVVLQKLGNADADDGAIGMCLLTM